MIHLVSMMKGIRNVDIRIIVVLTLILSLLTVFTTLGKFMMFNMLVALLVPSVFVYRFRKKSWQILLLGIFITYTISASVLLLTEEYYIYNDSRLILGKVVKKEITFKGQNYIYYSYTHNNYSNTFGTKVGSKIFNNIDDHVLLKVSHKRPWYHKVIYSAHVKERSLQKHIENKK